MFDGITFAYQYFLYLLFFIPVLAVWYWKFGKKKKPPVSYSTLTMFKSFSPTWRERLTHLPAVIRLIALSFLIIALARPQKLSSGENIYTEGIDIAMLLDISGSMLAEDFKPNRIEAAKKVIDDFIKRRSSDRIGLVIFARESFTQCPLTIDYSVLRNLLLEIKSGMIEDGTAIGNAIANGVNRLKDSDAKSKVIILLTDGVNNSGEVDPFTAAQIAKSFGIRIYTIGVGSMGQAPYPVQTPFGVRYQMVPVEIDEILLKKIADETNGKYFRATGNKQLEEIYREIDKLEKTKVEVASYRHAEEMFYSWLGGGIILILLEVTLSGTILRRLP